MNMHVPQDIQSRVELEQLMSVTKNFCSAQSNKPVMGIIQDSLVGAYLMTERNVMLSRDQMMDVLMHYKGWNGQMPVPAIMTPKECFWTGKQMLSLLMPEDLFYTAHSKDDADPLLSTDDRSVIIRYGQILSGRLSKKQIGKSYNSVLHRIWKRHGETRLAEFINSIQRMVDHWLTGHSFSTGIADCVPAKDADPDIVPKALRDVTAIINNNLPQIEHPLVEQKINQILNSARDRAGEDQLKRLPSNHGMKTMVDAGSKGSLINICQFSQLAPSCALFIRSNTWFVLCVCVC